MTKQRLDRRVGPAGIGLPGQPTRHVAHPHRRLAGVCAVLAAVAAAGLGAVALHVTQTSALYTSTAGPQHDTISAGTWSPAPTGDTLTTDTSAQSPTVNPVATDTPSPSPTGNTSTTDTSSPWPAANPLKAETSSSSSPQSPPVDCGSPGQYVRVVYGTSGDDTLYGGAEREVIMGLGGDDTIYGGDSGDCLVGGDGNDKLYGGTQDDILIGGNDDNSLGSDSIQDLLDGGPGYDVCIADAGVVTESNCEAAR